MGGAGSPTWGAHHREVERRTGKRHPDLDGEECPELGQRVWQWFSELHRTRDVGMAAGPINHREIEAWARNTRRSPKPWEVAVILAIDLEWRTAEMNRTKREEPE